GQPEREARQPPSRRRREVVPRTEVRHPDEVEEHETEHERADERRDRVRDCDLAEPLREERHRRADRLLVARDRESRVREEEEEQPAEEQETADDAPARPAIGVPAQRTRGGARLRAKTIAAVFGVGRGLIDKRAEETNERAGDGGDRPVRRVACGEEEGARRTGESARRAIEHRAEVIAEVTEEPVRRRRRRAAERWIDLGTREDGGHAQ